MENEGQTNGGVARPIVAPLVSAAIDWRHVGRRLGETPVGASVHALLEHAGQGASPLWAPICLAWWIVENETALDIGDELRIAVLGVEQNDSALDGRCYQLLPWLLSKPHLRVAVELVGPQLVLPTRANDLDRFGLKKARTTKATCGAWWAKRRSARSRPNLFVMFHPGLESQASNWMKPKELPALLQTDTPVAVFSYDVDEAERDLASMTEYGAEMASPPRACPLAVRTDNVDATGGVIFGGAAFSLTGFKRQRHDKHRLQSIETLSTSLRTVFEDRDWIERHSDAFRPCYVERDGKLCTVLRVFDVIYFDPDSHTLFIAHAGKEDKKFPEWPADGLNAKLAAIRTPVDRAGLAAEIYRRLTRRRVEP